MAKLIICLMYPDKELLSEVKEKLGKEFGEPEEEISYDFNFTKYYKKEMGPNLKKSIIIFKQQINTEQLADIKKYTNSLEHEYRTEGKRRVNIDPGYLTKEELILASNKKSPYKIGLTENIYAHLTLKFEKNKCVTTARTYPDFKTKMVKEFLLRIIQ